jgi:small subunit ribosomal protein S15
MPLSKEVKNKIVTDFGTSASDTGAESVQVALLTARITALTEHLQKNAKDFSSKRGLLKLISQRRKVLDYIECTNNNLYKDITKRLSL